MLVTPSTPGTRLGAGHPESREDGMASDDPGEPAEYECDICHRFFTEDESGCAVDHEFGDLCAQCVKDIEWRDTPHTWIIVGAIGFGLLIWILVLMYVAEGVR